MENMKQHPLSFAFPAMPAEQFQALKDSVMAIGIQEPITVFEGMVIDGWHRKLAADELSMVCPMVDLGDVDPQDFVVAKNKARRHSTASQIAAAVVSVYQWQPAHRPDKGAPGAPLQKTNDELAEIAGTSKRTIQQAKTVESKATPAIKEAVKSGDMSLKKAVEIINPSKAKAEAVAPQPVVATDLPPFEDNGGFDRIEELKAVNAENTKLREVIETDDKAAALLCLQNAHEVVQCRNDEYLQTIASYKKRIDRLTRELDRCGKAVGELDRNKIALAVEAMAHMAKEEK